ncbi:hypothetical protein EPUS_00715 [Endocarpon pusillum Z07020]|uniref:Nephrocystin 3-like N-terminal domain-containing protein n=1 Tax=Endocarpon pusillum (strain Z07020 / HMAS-L-300199) TaxID=1263415 RepID=U1HV76_ENDPU|nr:uncharacterized protein EPUS_00715 [Endocarpon pusillum Z07020]ERF74585.1 hypothetical protein EPUS_00715 [Endocarpon pusillum Z07020]
MEGVAAFALACNVVQVVELSIEVAGIIQQTYSRGRSDDNATTQDISERLNTLSQTLNQSLTADARHGSPTIAELQLQQIAPECSKIALELGRELDLFKTRSGKRNALRKGIRAMMKKGHIEKQKAKLQDYERILNTGLLVNLREQNNAALVLQQDGFKNLGQTMQTFIKNVAAGHSRTEDILRSEHALTRQLLDEEGRKIERNLGAQINNLSKVHLDGDRYDNLLKSLEYPEMNWRPSQIGDAGSKTFEWVFDDILPNTYYGKERPWDSFSNWLTSGTGIYWIQGKAGSGKSTLMKHLWQHDTTREILKNWCSTKKLVIVSFGFWLSGSPMQRSLRGILCSLLYQVLNEHQESLPGFVEPTSKLFMGKKSPQDWSLRELSTFLQKTVHRLAETSAFCFFLDGLDELDKSEDPRELSSLISTLISEVNVKACVSSRPEQFYCDEFRGAPLLELQDLTKKDIMTFTTEQLSDVQTSGRLGDLESDIRDLVIHEIVTKAAGVFLWVRLALRDVLRGLTIRASWKELLARISRLPADVERLYEDILERYAEDWHLVKEEAALYFATLLLAEEYSISGPYLDIFAIIASKWRQGWSDWRPNFLVEELRKVCYHTMLRIQIVCGGMLEVTEHDEVVEPETDPDNPVEFSFRGRRVLLFHRTVRDFLMDNPAGHAILGCSTISKKDLFHAMTEAHLFFRTMRLYHSSWDDIAKLIRSINRYHRLNGYVSDDEIVANLNQVQQYLPQIAHAALAEQFDLPHEIDHSIVQSNRSCEYQLATYSFGVASPFFCAEDLVGLTLQMGISAYLENFLRAYSDTQLQMPKLHKQYKDYLLLCACYGYAMGNLYSTGIRPMEQVMVQLLNIGADPNAKLFLQPSLPYMTTPGSTLLLTKKQRMMTTNFCELFWHFLEKGFRLEDSEFFYYTVGYECVPMAGYRGLFQMGSLVLLFQATRRQGLVSSWDAMVQICPNLTLFDRCEAEPDNSDRDVVLVRSMYIKDHDIGERAVVPTSDQSEQLLLVVDMLERLNADQAIGDDARYEKRKNLRSQFDQKLQEVVESNKEEVNYENFLAEKGLSTACSDPVTLPGPIPMYENDSDDAMTSDGIAKYCEVCKQQRKELLKYRWVAYREMKKKPLKLLISQGLDVRENYMVSS